MKKDQPLLTQSDSQRSITDAAGVVPLVAGAIAVPDLKDNALYIDHPIFQHDPPRVNLKTGKWSNHTGKVLSKIAKAMQICHISMYDAICVQKSEKTPLARILYNIFIYERHIINKILKDKASISDYNSSVRLNIVKVFRTSTLNETEQDEQLKVKARLRSVIFDGTKNRINAYEKIPLFNNRCYGTEPFQGLWSYSSFFDNYVTQNKIPDAKAKAELDTKLKAQFKSQEEARISAFVRTSRAYHVYYELFLNANKLKKPDHMQVDYSTEVAAISGGVAADGAGAPHADDEEQRANIEAMAAANRKALEDGVLGSRFLSSGSAYLGAQELTHLGFAPSPSDKDHPSIIWLQSVLPIRTSDEAIASDAHIAKAKKLLSNYIWLILIERVEVLYSVVFTFFKTYVGAGSGLVNKFTDSLVESLVIAAFEPLFQASSDISIPEQQRTDKLDQSLVPRLMRKEIFDFGVKMKARLPIFLQNIYLPNLSTCSPESKFQNELDFVLNNSLLKARHCQILNNRLTLPCIAIASISKDIVETAVNDILEVPNNTLIHWNRTVDGSQMVFPVFVHTLETDRLVKLVHDKMNNYVQTNLSNKHTTSAISIFAAKVILTLNRHDALFCALFHISEDSRLLKNSDGVETNITTKIANKLLRMNHNPLYTGTEDKASYASVPTAIFDFKNSEISENPTIKNLFGENYDIKYTLDKTNLLDLKKAPQSALAGVKITQDKKPPQGKPRPQSAPAKSEPSKSKKKDSQKTPQRPQSAKAKGKKTQ